MTNQLFIFYLNAKTEVYKLLGREIDQGRGNEMCLDFFKVLKAIDKAYEESKNAK